MTTRRRELTIDEYAKGIEAGDRAVLGRAISLIESLRDEDQAQARDLLSRLLPRTGRSRRVGISGVPGVGKSTFIEALGTFLTSKGHRVAVLAVDPSSAATGGSILGDKTRMQKLASDPAAFIRPSPSSGALGGVAQRTRESILLCEAAGFDVILVETVGVGQSETLVAGMVDLFLLLMLAGAGDELQGIKRGILELADLIAINKADGDNLTRARQAQGELQMALRILRQNESWRPPVLLTSALSGSGIPELWAKAEQFFSEKEASGKLSRKREQQQILWMWQLIESQLIARLKADEKIVSKLPELEAKVRAGEISPTVAADTILKAAFGPPTATRSIEQNRSRRPKGR